MCTYQICRVKCSRAFEVAGHVDTLGGWVQILAGNLIESYRTHLFQPECMLCNALYRGLCFALLACCIDIVCAYCAIGMGKKNISFELNSNVEAAVMVCLVENVEKEPTSNIVTCPQSRDVVTKAMSLNVVAVGIEKFVGLNCQPKNIGKWSVYTNTSCLKIPYSAGLSKRIAKGYFCP